MERRKLFADHRGFTLVEILIAVAMAGIVVAAMYSLFVNMQRTTVNQEEVIDVQQNLRVAMDALARDIQMAGFLVPTDNVVDISTPGTLELRTASPHHAFALLRLGDRFEIPAGTDAAQEFPFTVADGEMLHYFEPGYRVRIIRSETGRQPLPVRLQVQSTNPGSTEIVLKGFTTAEEVSYRSGDMIVRVNVDTPPEGSLIRWRLNGKNLERSVDSEPVDIVAPDVQAVQFRLILDDGTVVDTTPSPDQVEQIAAVRVELEAATHRQLDKITRERTLASVIRLRN